jgi:hypothetical protein
MLDEPPFMVKIFVLTCFTDDVASIGFSRCPLQF